MKFFLLVSPDRDYVRVYEDHGKWAWYGTMIERVIYEDDAGDVDPRAVDASMKDVEALFI